MTSTLCSTQIIFNLNYANNFTQSNTLAVHYDNFKYARFLGTPCFVYADFIAPAYECFADRDAQSISQGLACVSNEIGLWERVVISKLSSITMSVAFDYMDVNKDILQPTQESFHICVQFANNEVDRADPSNPWFDEYYFLYIAPGTQSVEKQLIPSLNNFMSCQILTKTNDLIVRTNFTSDIFVVQSGFNVKPNKDTVVLIDQPTDWYEVDQTTGRSIDRLKLELVNDPTNVKGHNFFIKFSKKPVTTKDNETIKMLCTVNQASNFTYSLFYIFAHYKLTDAWFTYLRHKIWIVDGVGEDFFQSTKNWLQLFKNTCIFQLSSTIDRFHGQYTDFQPAFKSQNILFLPFTFFPNMNHFIYNTDAGNTLAISNATFQVYSLGTIIISFIKETNQAHTYSEGDAIVFKITTPSGDIIYVKKPSSDGSPLFKNVPYNALNRINLVAPQFIDGFLIDLLGPVNNACLFSNIYTGHPNQGVFELGFRAPTSDTFNKYDNFFDFIITTYSPNFFLNPSGPTAYTAFDNIYALADPLIGNNITEITPLISFQPSVQGFIFMGNVYPTYSDRVNLLQNPNIPLFLNVTLEGRNSEFNTLIDGEQLSWVVANNIKTFTTQQDSSTLNWEIDPAYLSANINNYYERFYYIPTTTPGAFYARPAYIEKNTAFTNGIRIFKDYVSLDSYYANYFRVHTKLIIKDIQFTPYTLSSMGSVQLYASQEFRVPANFGSFKKIGMFTHNAAISFLSCSLLAPRRGILPIMYAKNKYNGIIIEHNLKVSTKLENFFRIYSDTLVSTSTDPLASVIIILS